MPSLRKHLPRSYTFSRPPIRQRLRYSSTEMRSDISWSSALWWVRNGRADAPPASACKNGCFDLDEAALCHECAQRVDRVGAREEQLARALVGEQVELAIAVARPVSPSPWYLAGGGRSALVSSVHVCTLRASCPRWVTYTQPACFHDVADVEVNDALVGLLSERVLTNVQLDLPEESRRSRNVVLPWPRLEIRRPARR